MSNITNARAALALCTEDELASLAHLIVQGEFGNVSNYFLDTFHDAEKLVDEAAAQFAARHDHDAPCAYDWQRHPDDPSYGMRVSVFGRA